MTLINKDINKLPTDGYVIFPLSMSRLHGDQSPKKCINYISTLDTKIHIPGNDIVFLYTNGLYFNTKESAYTVRSKTNQLMIEHRNALKKLILKKVQSDRYIAGAFHFLPFDYIILNSDEYQRYFDILVQCAKDDKDLKTLLKNSLKNREYFAGNVNFMLEEIVVGHILREHLVELPKTLVKNDTFRLITYPGPIFKPEVYVWQDKLLPQKDKKKLGRYYNSYYDPKKKVLYKFNEISLKPGC
jgi:hypothetical protein